MVNRKCLALAAAAMATAFAGAVLATPGSSVSSVVQARASFVNAVDFKIKVEDGHYEIIHVPNAGETVMQQVIIEPRGHTGWHSHPGPAIALVKSGQVTLYHGDDPRCAGHSYSAGQAFVDRGQGHAHLAANLSSTVRAELWITYLDVAPPGSSPRIDQPDPRNCPF